MRGYLAEPVEIEAALLGAENVSDAVVVTDRATEPPRLVAYVVPAPGSEPSPAAVRRSLLAAGLPQSAVPATVVVVPGLPRTVLGDADRTALPSAPPPLAGDEPRNDWEEAVAGVWARALGLRTVGIHDDFRALGGDDPLVQEIAARIESELRVPLPFSAVAQANTVAELARLVAQADADIDTLRHHDVLPLRTDGAGTPLFCFVGAGGYAVVMAGIATHFAGERPVYAMQAHGLSHRAVPDWSVAAIARRHARTIRLLRPRGPYLLLGHSFGGVIALEVAQQLTAIGEEVALLTIVDSFPPTKVKLTLSGSFVESHGEAPPPPTPSLAAEAEPDADGDGGAARKLRVMLDRAAQLARLPLTGIVQLPDTWHTDNFLNQSRFLMMAYKPRPYLGRALLWDARDTETGLRPVEGPWGEILTGDAVARTVVGDHNSVLREPLFGRLVDDMRAMLASAPDRDLAASPGSPTAGWR
ncbi:thioesterase domain-containing protein [Pseudofrankia sp. BMG5.37]|uniref:thioesterase domain-containing protein n=1 Tax=Pseudofrankia sp. BMG5.37 TaxID=3050035 RepID=UPI002893C852|nr:thioesterase domain-containing protein [Pseudofrankia sp. BMG5.37]MDT3445760.1 thioesterase domain-containing protein [Pseudofrankia sp. BMG5.37]